ncbi:hypothetical protein [Streptomyces griseofuscus]|uniref:hypothetical protein n=1 Tax=Streptomyces griseofuscus TaxID=146922 RepID=UPI0033CA0CB9
MSDDEPVGGTDPSVVRQPLPPEVPMPRPPVVPETDPAGAEQAPEGEWWRAADETDAAAVPAPRQQPGPAPDPASDASPDSPGPAPSSAPASGPGDGTPEPEPGPEQGTDWWHGSAVREELADVWSTHGQDGVAAAVEIGEFIGDAIASRLPDPYAPAGKPKLDVRWLRLKYNLPAVPIALLVTWGGHSAVDRMTGLVDQGGLLAPVGFVLIFVLLALILMTMPIGSMLAEALSHLVSWVVQTAIRLLGRAWTLPFTGYLLRLAGAVVIWSFVIAVGRVIWRGAVHLLTGA